VLARNCGTDGAMASMEKKGPANGAIISIQRRGQEGSVSDQSARRRRDPPRKKGQMTKKERSLWAPVSKRGGGEDKKKNPITGGNDFKEKLGSRPCKEGGPRPHEGRPKKSALACRGENWGGAKRGKGVVVPEKKKRIFSVEKKREISRKRGRVDGK